MFSIISHSKKAWIPAIITTLCLCGTPLMGNWSMPPEVIYPTSPPANATEPSIAYDGNGDAVAVWIDETGTGSLQAATLAAGAVNGLGQPAWVLTNPVATSNVKLTFFAQGVGMDFNGNATAAWTDGTKVFVATLSPGGHTWSSPTQINTPISLASISTLSIAVNPNGDAIVTWRSDSVSYQGSVFANVFDAGTHSWRGPVDILGTGNIELDIQFNQAAIDPTGNAVIVVTDTSNNAQVVRYNFSNNTFTSFFSSPSSPIAFQWSAIDSAGNATIVWFEQDNTVHAATLKFSQSSFSNPTTLSNSLFLVETSIPQVVTDASGNAVAVWPDSSGALGSARFSFATQSWTVLPLLDLGGNTPNVISMSGDADGNVVASWTIILASTGYVQAAALAAGASTWVLLTQLSPSTESDFISQIALTPKGDAIAIWENGVTTQFDGVIESSIFLNMFSHGVSLTSFTGKVKRDIFFTQTDRIHQLNWSINPNPIVVEFHLYRNSVLIATIPAIGTTFSYEDHNRSKKVSDTYKLTAVNGAGVEGPALFVTLQ